MALKAYELLIITPVGVDVAEKSKFDAIIEKLGGKVLNFVDLGRRALAFAVNKQKEGGWLHWELELAPDQVAALKKSLRLLNAEALRFMLTLKSSRLKTRPRKRERKRKKVAAVASVVKN